MVLAATADIVLFVDGSGSLVGSEMGVEAYSWFGDTILALEEELRDRGIGADDPEDSNDDYRQNRYSIVTFGGGLTNNWEYIDWQPAEDAVADIGPFQQPGQDHEDAVEALVLSSDDGFEGNANFNFRNNAAVHYIFLTDGGSGDGNNNSVYGPDYERKADSSFEEYADATYGDIVDLLDHTSLLDANDGPNYVSDATITFIGGASFDESEFPTFATGGDHDGDEILGVDLNVDDFWDLHLQDNNYSVSYAADVFYFDSGETPPSWRVEVDDVFIDNNENYSYEDIRTALLAEDLVDNGGADYPGWLDQTGYFGELHAFLAWESDGSYWDLDALNSSNEIAYRECLVDDIFNKVARQVADFNEDFEAIDNFDPVFIDADFNVDYLGDFDDVATWIFARYYIDNYNPSAQLLTQLMAIFDLDQNGTLGAEDIELLVESIFRGLMGDADWNGYVDADDLNELGQHWLETDIYDWMLCDFNGDGTVNANDLTYIGQNWLQGPNQP